jgi:hypothetical protein
MNHILSRDEYVNSLGKEIDQIEEKRKVSTSKKSPSIPARHIQHFLEEFTKL